MNHGHDPFVISSRAGARDEHERHRKPRATPIAQAQRATQQDRFFRGAGRAGVHQSVEPGASDMSKKRFLKRLNAIADELDDVVDYTLKEYPVGALELLDAAQTIVESVIETMEQTT